MKSTILVLVGALVLTTVGVGAFGFWEAQKVKKVGEELAQITGNSLEIEEVRQNDESVNLAGWESLAQNANNTRQALEKLENMPSGIRENTNQYYGAQAEDRYREARYFQAMSEMQQKLDLKSEEPKSKGQVETIQNEFARIRVQMNGENMALGPQFNEAHDAMEKEANAYGESLSALVRNMNSGSEPTRLRVAGLDKAIDDLKQEIANSLNEWVALAHTINEEIAKLENASWRWPF